MTYEEMIEAKVRLIEVDSHLCMGIGLLFAFAAIMSSVLRRRTKYHSDLNFILLIAIPTLLFISVALVGQGAYDKLTAELKAKSDMANYNLVELNTRK